MRILAECKSCHTQYDVTAAVDSGFKPECRRCKQPLAVSPPRAKLALVVRCAGCGAARGEGGDSCNFCGARFSAADLGWGSMCPGCYCRLPIDAAFCVECGLKINPVKLDAVSTTLKCPRCSCALNTRHPEHESVVELHECPSCAGTWVDAETFKAICSDKDKSSLSARVVAAKRRRLNFELPEKEVVKYVPCPVCTQLMNRRNFARVSGVIIDLCQNHGVWLDNQELGRIVQFIQSGGMEQSRQREAETALHEKRMKSKVPLLPMDTAVSPFLMTRTGRSTSSIESVDLVLGAVSLLADVFLND